MQHSQQSNQIHTQAEQSSFVSRTCQREQASQISLLQMLSEAHSAVGTPEQCGQALLPLLAEQIRLSVPSSEPMTLHLGPVQWGPS